MPCQTWIPEGKTFADDMRTDVLRERDLLSLSEFLLHRDSHFIMATSRPLLSGSQAAAGCYTCWGLKGSACSNKARSSSKIP